MQEINTPVLLIVFNRPDTTKKVFEAIRLAKPSKLYISSDAPREANGDDYNKNNEVKQIVEQVDWDCDVKYRYLDKNLGCGIGVSSAISWAFENEEKLIILEDDCVPAQPFFTYCDTLLDRYKDDKRIWLISGRSHHPEYLNFKKYDYIFSYFGHIWGWATWKRCWEHFDIEMKDINVFLDEKGFYNAFFDKKIAKGYTKRYRKYVKNEKLKFSTWDYMWFYTRIKNRGLSIVPSKNLIHNIGDIGTHANRALKSHKLRSNENYELEKHPNFILPFYNYEKLHMQKHIVKSNFWIKKIIKKLMKALLIN